MVIVCLATTKDHDAYCALVSEADALHAQKASRYYRFAGLPSRSKEYFESLLKDPNKAIFLAEFKGSVAGYAHVEARTEPDVPVLVPMKWTNISDIVVGEKFQRKGVGKALMTRAKSWAKEMGSKDVRLSVADFNETAKAFYKKEGFNVKHEVLAFSLD